jgi:hypothetical protein
MAEVDEADRDGCFCTDMTAQGDSSSDDFWSLLQAVTRLGVVIVCDAFESRWTPSWQIIHASRKTGSLAHLRYKGLRPYRQRRSFPLVNSNGDS